LKYFLNIIFLSKKWGGTSAPNIAVFPTTPFLKNGGVGD